MPQYAATKTEQLFGDVDSAETASALKYIIHELLDESVYLDHSIVHISVFREATTSETISAGDRRAC